MHLPFRPFPESDESLPGYSVRITAWYGYKSPDAFARQNFGYTLPPGLPDQSVAMDRWMQSLEIAIKVDAHVLSGHFSAIRQKHKRKDLRNIIGDTVISSPRVCEYCLADKGYHCFDWQVAHLIVCNQHSAPILDQCPTCNSPLKWNESLLSGCSDCGYKWGARALQPSVDFEACKQAQETIEDFDNLHQAYLHCAFSAGHTVWPKAKVPYNSQSHFELMRSAYRLVLDEDYNKQFAGLRCHGDRHILSDAVADIRKERISALFCPDGCTDIAFFSERDPVEYDYPAMVIPAKHHKHLKNLRPSDIAEGDVVSEALGIELTQLNRLVSRGLIECISSSQILRDRLFSLKQVAENLEGIFLKSYSPEAQGDDALSLWQAEKVAEKFGFDLVDCLEWCRMEKMPFSLADQGRPLSRIRVNRPQLVTRCESEFLQQDDQRQLDRPTVLKVLGVPDKILDLLCKKGVLPSQKWYGAGAMFELGAIKEFLSQYRVARRESVILGVPTARLWNEFGLSGRRILIDSLPGGHIVGIVESRLTHSEEAA